MYVVHAVDYDSMNSLQVLEATHCRYSVSLHQDVTSGKELKSFQGHAIWADETLSTLDEFLSVADQTSDLNDLTVHFVILHDFHCLLERNRPRQQFNEISCPDDRIGVPCLPGCQYCHRTLNCVKFCRDIKLFHSLLDKGPYLFDILFSVLWKEHRET